MIGGGHFHGPEGRRLGSPAVTRTFLALATSAAQDLRDRDGVARPLLRRSALRLTMSARPPLRRLGAEYLRVDPPTQEELAQPVPPTMTRAQRALLFDDSDVGPRGLLPAPEPAESADLGGSETPGPVGREAPR